MPETKLPTVREHADAIITKMAADGKLTPDPDGALRASGIPTFSKGTATRDERTGQTVVPASQAETPTFTDGAVAVPEGVQSAAPVAAPQATATPAEAAPQEQAAPAEGAAAAEQAAQQIADAFAEYEEFEVEDGDLGEKYPVRVPKKFATSAKRGYPRRAVYDRSVSYLKNAEPVLRQMIEDGRINNLLPLIQEALADPQGYGEYVFRGFQRKRSGLPLIEQARQEAAAAAQQQQTATPEFDIAADDPFLAERIRPVVNEVQTLRQTVEQMQTERQRQEQQQTEFAQRQAWQNQQFQYAHNDLARMYPDEFSGDFARDQAVVTRAIQYAQKEGYLDAYGPRGGMLFAAQVLRTIDDERRNATGSPTAQALAQVENRNMDLARQQAAQASRMAGAGAPTQAPLPAPVPKPTTTLPNGQLKSPGQFLREQQAYMAARGA